MNIDAYVFTSPMLWMLCLAVVLVLLMPLMGTSRKAALAIATTTWNVCAIAGWLVFGNGFEALTAKATAFQLPIMPPVVIYGFSFICGLIAGARLMRLWIDAWKRKDRKLRFNLVKSYPTVYKHSPRLPSVNSTPLAPVSSTVH